MVADEVLYEAVRRGDRSAFDLLYARYERPLYGFLTRMVARELAEEIFQETLLTVFRGDVLDWAKGSFRSWIFRVARNLALNRARGHGREAKAMADLRHQHVEAAGDGVAGVRRGEVERAVARLPAILADVYRLRMTGMTYDEIAAALSLPVGTVKSRLHELIQRLKEEPWTAP